MIKKIVVFTWIACLCTLLAMGQAFAEDMTYAAANGANEFAFRLSAELLQQTGDGNFICSPFSVWLPLAALVNAIDEPSKPDLVKALNAAGIDEEWLNRSASRMLFDLTNQESTRLAAEFGEDYHYDPMKIVNAVFVSHNMTLNQDFSEKFMDSYNGAARSVDFNSPHAVHEVNRWASENTEGMIPEIISKFSPNTIAVIANAIYFADRWNWEFYPFQTELGSFHSPKGDTDAFFMLREGEDQLYYEDNDMQAMPLTFTTGGGLLILLPKEVDAAEMLSSMTNERFQSIINTSDEKPGKLLLPRFSITSEVMEISNILKTLGIPLFDQSNAPLTGLVEENVPVWVTEVLHKAVIEVDEKGTTAAAVTIMDIDYGAPPTEPDPAKPFEMICDKPFVFVLYGHTKDGGNQVLFTGVVNQPQ